MCQPSKRLGLKTIFSFFLPFPSDPPNFQTGPIEGKVHIVLLLICINIVKLIVHTWSVTGRRKKLLSQKGNISDKCVKQPTMSKVAILPQIPAYLCWIHVTLTFPFVLIVRWDVKRFIYLKLVFNSAVGWFLNMNNKKCWLKIVYSNL